MLLQNGAVSLENEVPVSYDTKYMGYVTQQAPLFTHEK